MAAVLPSASTPLPARGNRPSVISITGDAMRGATEGTTTGWYAKELDERASIAWSSVDGNLDAYLSPGDEMSGRSLAILFEIQIKSANYNDRKT